VVDYLIDLKLVARKALADKLDADPEFARKLAYYRDKIAMETVLGKIAKTADTDAAEHAAYDAAAKAQPPEPEIHARHILLPDEASAKAALARVKGGEDFAKVATELSKDPGGEGGDLGWFTKDRMVPEFSEVAFKLEPGQISDPVKTQFGWHIIKVEEKRMKTFPPFDQVKEQAARYVQQKAQTEMITGLRKDAKIERFDAAPAPAPSAEPAPAATPDAAKK
jgi:peptidyl-prolyl cis-trans isomerase C